MWMVDCTGIMTAFEWKWAQTAQGSINCWSVSAFLLRDTCQRKAWSKYPTEEMQRCDNLGKESRKQGLQKSPWEKHRDWEHFFTLNKNQHNPQNKTQTSPKSVVSSKMVKFPLKRCSCHKRNGYQDHKKEQIGLQTPCERNELRILLWALHVWYHSCH